MEKKPTILICLQCGSTQRDEHGCKISNPASTQLAEEVKKALQTSHPNQASQLNVQLVRCFHHCETPIAWALRDTGLFNYVFAPATTPQDIAQIAATWVDAPHQGRMPSKELPTHLRHTMKSRIPPLPK